MERARRRSVTARQLSRETGAILRTVAAEKVPITVTRGGVPVAELRPLTLIPWAPTETDVACGTELPDVDIEALDIGPAEKSLLTHCDDGFGYDAAMKILGPESTHGEVAMAMVRLETRGLARKTWNGYRFTDLGKDAAQVLRAAAEGGD